MGWLDPRDARIAELETENTALRTQVTELQALVADLQRTVTELKARLDQDSSNSSRPPSSDPPWAKKPNKDKKKKRRRGGQPGHKGHSRSLVPVEEVNHLITHVPSGCEKCGSTTGAVTPEPRRHQVWDLPPVKPEVTEHQCFAVDCACGHRTWAKLPRSVPSGAFGPTVMAVVALLAGTYRISRRGVVQLCADLFGLEVSLGAVSKMEGKVTGVLAGPANEAADFVRKQQIVGMDETSWCEAKGKAWLWTATTPLVTVFRIARSRGAKVAKEMLGGEWKGLLITDRWKSYAWLTGLCRQVCWAHLIRDFRGMKERGGRGSRIGGQLLDQAKLMFRWWHRVRDGTMTSHAFKLRLARIRVRVEELLRAGEQCTGTRTAGMCREIRKEGAALWNFAYVEGAEPTNNASERAIRPAVLWRKGSFGTDSERGSRFVERMLTVTTTLRQQKRHVLSYIVAACEADLRGDIAPSILPDPVMYNQAAA